MKSKQALDLFDLICKKQKIVEVLDIGCGYHKNYCHELEKRGYCVTTIDRNFEATINSVYPDGVEGRLFESIWCSHVLEHQPNPHTFLKSIFSNLKDGGVLALTVPPNKDRIVGGHVTMWNAGLLLYHLVLAGFDCGDAAVATYNYNISVVLIKKEIKKMPALNFSNGDIEMLSEYFPKGLDVKQGFNGAIELHNWNFNNA